MRKAITVFQVVPREPARMRNPMRFEISVRARSTSPAQSATLTSIVVSSVSSGITLSQIACRLSAIPDPHN